MAVQFAGSGSTGDRRRRRLAVGGDDTGTDSAMPETDGAELESQLVASEAAGPWVPVTEFRIWIYAVVIGLVLCGLSFLQIQPILFHPDVTPLSDHLLTGQRPLMIVCAQTLLLGLSAQLGMLIGWYRSRCKLDFFGRYRIWPCAVLLFAVGAFCLATESHRPVGEVIHRMQWLPWRGTTVGWLLPVCIVALPIALLLDREMRNTRASLFTLRLSIAMWLGLALLELYQPELETQAWYRISYMLLPMFASATLFVSLWQHARFVAYVNPDPSELDERSAWSLVLAAGVWTGRRLMFWKSRTAAEAEEEEDAKPKRRRKKAEGEETTATKRKRKAPAKKPASRTRTRKVVEDEEATEESEESAEATNEEVEESTWQDDTQQQDDASQAGQEEWEEGHTSPAAPVSRRNNGRFTQVHNSHNEVPAPLSRKQSAPLPQPTQYDEEEESSHDDQSNSANSDDESDNESYSQDGDTSDQMKGLSKRQKRELRKQMRDQERARHR